MRRVVVTGAAGISPIGLNWDEISHSLKNGISGIAAMPEWSKYDGLNTQLGGPVKNYQRPAHFNRKVTRGMGDVAIMAADSAEQALTQAGLLGDPVLKNGRVGVSSGSCAGSTNAVADFGKMLVEHSTGDINANTYIKMMAHTAPVNIGVYLGLTGRVITTSSACTSGSQGIGYAYEAIKYGMQDVMVAGGSEELCPTQAAVFDTMFATSLKNEQPGTSPAPFDVNRDGLVIGEGACHLILEEYEHAKARGASIIAELVGYGTNSDGAHVTQPQKDQMQKAIEASLKDAGIEADAIGYVNAHGTATARGDVAETHATLQALGKAVPISSTKSYTGHTLGACGALEAWISINMMNEGWFHPTLNLSDIDPACAELDYIREQPRNMDVDYIMTNNFAFGGINTSLIFRRFSE